MIVTYTPDEGDKREWLFKPERLLTTEAEAVERVTGMTYAEFGKGLFAGSITAKRALVWVMRKRDGEPDIKFRDVDFPVGALSLDLDPEEKALVRTAALNDPGLSDEDRAEVLAELGEEDAPDPKATGSGDGGG